MSPLFSALGGGGLPGPLGNMANFMQQFNSFKNMFQGNPQSQVQNLLNSGKMSREQFNQLQSMATQIQRMMGGK